MQLDNEDILLQICLNLENNNIRVLSLLSNTMLEVTKKLYSNNNFWFLRIRYHTRCELKSFREKIVCWRSVYSHFRDLSAKKWKTPDDASVGETVVLIHIESVFDTKTNLLDLACEEGYIEAMKVLLSDPEVRLTRDILYHVCTNGKTEVVRLLLQDRRLDPSGKNSSCLSEAARYGHTEVVRLLLRDGRADPSHGSGWCLRIASLLGHLEVVRLLLSDPRVDPRENSSWAIIGACERGHIEIVDLLLEDGRSDVTSSAHIQCAYHYVRQKSCYC